MKNQGTKIVRVVFADNTVLKIEAFVNEQFFLFDNCKSLTLYLPIKSETDENQIEAMNNGYIHVCIWDCNERYEDVTIDFLKEFRNISII